MFICVNFGQQPDAHPATLLLSLLNRCQGEKIEWKSLWVEIKARRSLTSYRHRQSRLDLRIINLIDCHLKEIWVMRNREKKKKKRKLLFLRTSNPIFSQTQLRSFVPDSFISHPKQHKELHCPQCAHPWLMGSAESCGRSIAEIAGTGYAQCRAAHGLFLLCF